MRNRDRALVIVCTLVVVACGLFTGTLIGSKVGSAYVGAALGGCVCLIAAVGLIAVAEKEGRRRGP